MSVNMKIFAKCFSSFSAGFCFSGCLYNTNPNYIAILVALGVANIISAIVLSNITTEDVTDLFTKG